MTFLPQPMNRRNFLRQSASTAIIASSASSISGAVARNNQPRLGICAASYATRSRFARIKNAPPELASFAGPVGQLKHFARYDSACAQIGVRGWDKSNLVRQIRDQIESTGTLLEGQIRLPKNESDADRFIAEIKVAKEAGVSILRTVSLGTRRYETFKTREAWDEFKTAAFKSLTIGEKIAAKEGVKLALENHKDWRVEELLGILNRISSPHLGINLDTGNSIALLEDPMEVVRAFAPFALTLHLKDMGVADYEDGFLLAEVPLGKGVIDIVQVVKICREANSEVQFNLEMITRDPLKIPCLSKAYWITFGEIKGQALAATLRRVQQHRRDDLQMIAHLPPAEKIKAEEENIRQSFEWWSKMIA